MVLYLLGILMGALDTGIITPARPLIAKDLGVDDSLGIWMITIYTLAYAAAIPVVGKLADRRGRKPIFLVSIAIFGIGSLLCGLAQDVGSFEMLIIARAIQAIGGGGILPIATAEIGSEVPEEKRGMALGLVGAVFGIANVFGASAGSLILDIVGSHNWQWIFYVNLPIAVAIVVIGWFVLPSPAVEKTKPLDIVGTFLLVGIILSLLYGIKNLDFFDFGASLASPDVWPFLVGCLVALPLFVLAERRAADPVLNLKYFTDRGIGLILVLSLLAGAVLMAVVFVPQLAENALRMPTGTGGYFVIVLGLASGIGAPISGRLTDRFGPKLVLGLGFSISAVAAVMVTWWMIPQPSMVSVITSLALIGLGLGFVVGSPLNYMMLQRTPPSESSSALGALSLIRSIGTTLAPAIMIGFVVQGTAGLQAALTADLPTHVQLAALPHAKELDERFAAWKHDERFADALAGVDLPDLTRNDVELDFNGGDSLPADLVDLLKTADVTTITERSKLVAERMFETTAPETIATIQSGIDSGTAGLDDALKSTGDARQEMTDGLASMDTQLDKMATALKKMKSSLAGMTTGIDKMGAQIDKMTTALAKMKSAIAGMDTGIKKMGKGLDGLDAAIAGTKKGIVGLDEAIKGMDAGLAQLREQLAQVQAMPSPPPGSIAGLEAAIADAEAQRDDAVAQRAATQAKLTGLTRQRAQLAKERAKLVKSRGDLASQRAKLAQGRSALVRERGKLIEGRDALATQREKLAAGRAKVTEARADLAKARKELDASRAEIEDTRAKMLELRAAVPGAFDKARESYLAEIEARRATLETTFSTQIGNGYRGVYLFDLAICLLALGVLVLIPAARSGAARDEA